MPNDDHPHDRPRPRKRPKQARSRLTVDAIVEAAAQVLVADGYDGLTTTRVAERAGVSIGTLYQYFPDKDALVAALVEGHLAAEEIALNAAFADLEATGDLAETPLAEAIDRLVEAFVGVFAEAPERSSALYAQVPYVKWQSGVLGVARRTTEAVTALLQAHAPDVRRPDAALAAFVVVHAVDTLTQRAVTERPADVASGAVTAEATDLVRRYLLNAPERQTYGYSTTQPALQVEERRDGEEHGQPDDVIRRRDKRAGGEGGIDADAVEQERNRRSEHGRDHDHDEERES